MKFTLFFALVFLQASILNGQEAIELYFDTYDARKYSHISIENSCGTVIIEPSDNELGARVEFTFDDEVSIQAAKLKGKIAIEKTIRNDSIILSTVFDESIYAERNILWEIKDNINIEYRVLVPRKSSCHVSQKYGKVIIGRNAIPISIKLDNSKLFAELSDNLTVVGNDFFIDASDVKELSVTGKNAELVLGNTGLGKLNLIDSRIESEGFESLTAELENSSLSCGITRSCELTAINSTVDFTDITSKAVFDIKETRLVVQKLPLNTQLKTVGGSQTFNLAKERNCRMGIFSELSNIELYLRGGNMQMDYGLKKKTEFDFPSEAVVTKERAVVAQRDGHGVEIKAQFIDGKFIMKK